MKTKTSLFVIGILIAMLAASLLTVLALFLTGTLAPNKPVLEFTVKQIAAKEYDGTPLTAQNGKLQAGEETDEDEEDIRHYFWESGWNNLKEGHTVKGTFYGSQTDVGISDSDLRVKVYDEKDRDVTSEYSIKVHNCELRVIPKVLTIRLNDQRIMYTGKAVLIEDYDVFDGFRQVIGSSEKGDGALVSGHTLKISFPGEFENVGDKLPSTYTDENLRVYDEVGNLITRNYDLRLNLSSNIEIVPRRIKVKALDAEKYYDGTPIDGTGKYEVIGSLAEGEYIGEVEFKDEKGNALSANAGQQRVKVSNISLYKQDGYNIVPSENYILETEDDDVYGTFIVKPRPVTVWANNIVKVYDGEELSVENSFTTDLTLEGYKIKGVKADGTLIDVYDGIYSITDATVEKDGENVSENFVIRYETARATVLPMKIEYRLNNPTSLPYTGKEIEIPLDGDDGALYGLENSIEKYIDDNNLSGKQVAIALNSIINGIINSNNNNYSIYFQQVCTRTVKNVDTYSFSAELSNEAAQDLFGKVGNVIFEFSEAKFKVSPVKLTASYNGATSKIYDGLEASAKLDSSNVVLTGFNGAELVVSTNFKYDDNNDVHVKCGTYYLTGKVVQITMASEDVTKNFTVAPFTVSVTITPRTIYARVQGQPREIDLEVTSIPDNSWGTEWDEIVDEITKRYCTYIDFQNLIVGDVINSVFDDEAFSFDCELDSRNNIVTVYVYLERVYNEDYGDVTTCYDVEDEPIIIVNLVEKTGVGA